MTAGGLLKTDQTAAWQTGIASCRHGCANGCNIPQIMHDLPPASMGGPAPVMSARWLKPAVCSHCLTRRSIRHVDLHAGPVPVLHLRCYQVV